MPRESRSRVAVQPKPLGRQVQQVQLAGEELGLHQPPLLEVLRGVHEPGPHAQRPQCVHLVLHQGDERGDDDPRTRPDQGRDLVAQRLAAAGRHEHDGVAARHHVLDDRFLLTAEGLVPEDPVQRGQRLARVASAPTLPASTAPSRYRPSHPIRRLSPVRRSLDHCVHDRRPHRQPRSYPQARPVKATRIHTFDRARHRGTAPGHADGPAPRRRAGPPRSRQARVSARTRPPAPPDPGSTAAPHRAPA